MILAGDIGGTNTRLALFDEQIRPLQEPMKFPTGNGQQLESQIKQVLEKFGKPVGRGCIAVAGPVIEGVCRSTNIGRTFVQDEIGKAVGLKSFTLINDLVGNASGIEKLGEDEIVTLQAGEGRQGSRAVVSPGTGLGEGILVYDGKYHRGYPSEGGHSRFAPTTPDEVGLLAFLQKQLGDVIVEHVLSGRGFGYAFDYYVSLGRKPAGSVVAEMAKADATSRNGVVSKAALEGRCDVCKAAMDLYIHALAIECASMATKSFAIGGIYIGGGIPPKILPLLKTPAFINTFNTHITMGEFLKRVPVKVILNDDTALEGAALYGLRFG
jgi:glucokinase